MSGRKSTATPRSTEERIMAEYNYSHEPNAVINLRVWALGQMVWGAFLAAVGVVVVICLLVGTYLAGLLLPEQSKQAPSPYGALEIVQTIDVA
ncbi:hypothetical protein C5F44_07755 [Fuscovulum blasticum DSM 2131]|uniref:Uncharacterized protein n=2 Tax=Fuscovulum blasticum TaxID=1075 RepID=A0A2T4J9W4_FUSBL|nr:hypothetical protein C5F44_07755 [Fuscovulum blasticum DSM 2131]